MTITAPRLARHRERILQLWRERSGEEERELVRVLDLLASEATPEQLRAAGARLARSQASCMRGVELLQQVASDVLEAEEPLSQECRAALAGAFAELRVACVEAMQERQRQLERAAQRSEERYLAAGRAAAFAIWDWDLKGDQLHWSRSLEDLFGHPVDALSSLALWLEHVHPTDRERVARGLGQALEGGATRWSDTLQLLRRDGTYAAVLARAWVIHDAQGDPARLVGGLIDITEQWRLEAELREAVRVRDDFISIASHELRTPLSAMRLQIESLVRGPLLDGLDERVKTRLRGAERGVERMAQLVNDLLDVTRLNAGKITLVPEQMSLPELVREVAARLQPELQRSGSSLRLELAEVVGRWDRGRLDQVASNLLSNAIKYGQGAPIEIRLAACEPWAVLRVQDHGIGISPAQRERLFQRFERAVSTRHFSGFGLGLWIVKRILDAMGGEVDVTSELGKGATFEVRLPLKEAA